MCCGFAARTFENFVAAGCFDGDVLLFSDDGFVQRNLNAERSSEGWRVLDDAPRSR